MIWIPLLFAQLFAWGSSCSEGGECSGGGNRTSEQFYDEAVRKGEFDLYSHHSTRKVIDHSIRKHLNRFDALLPEFGKDLKTPTRWYFVEDVATLSSSQTGIPSAVKGVAIHQIDKVFIDKNWYMNPKTKDSERSSLLMHELVQGFRLRAESRGLQPIEPERVTDLNNKILNGDFSNDSLTKDQLELRDHLFRWFKQTYFLPKENNRVEFFQKDISALCSQNPKDPLAFQKDLRQLVKKNMEDYRQSLLTNPDSILTDSEKTVLAMNFSTRILIPYLGFDPYESRFTSGTIKKICMKEPSSTLQKLEPSTVEEVNPGLHSAY